MLAPFQQFPQVCLLSAPIEGQMSNGVSDIDWVATGSMLQGIGTDYTVASTSS